MFSEIDFDFLVSINDEEIESQYLGQPDSLGRRIQLSSGPQLNLEKDC